LSVSRLQLQMTNDDHAYDLTVTAGEDGGLVVEVIGVDTHGEQIGELQGSVPAADLVLISRLLTTAGAALETAAAPGGPTLEERRAKHRNSHQPWTEEDDQRLRELAAAPGANIRDLMEAFGRSRSAIKARLPRVGVHEELPAQAAADAGTPGGVAGP
jgi:hypothetical protein